MSQNFEPNRLTEYSDDAIIAEIHRVAKLVNRPRLTTTEFRKHAHVGLSTLRRRFGSWRAALIAAGLSHLGPKDPPPSKSTALGRSWTKRQIVAEIKRIANGCSTLTVKQFESNSPIGAGTVRGRFGSWRSALSAAGLEPVQHGRRYSDIDCFENLLNVWTHYGRVPKYKEMQQEPSIVGGKAYTVRWGSWNKAIHAFCEYASSDTEQLIESSGNVESPTRLKLVQPQERREPPMGMRYRVLVRDRFRCVLCGRSPASDLSCKLHIDHVVPFSKGGKTTEDNLRVLCSECNLGKGDKVENRV